LLTGIIFMDKKVKQDTNDGTFSVWVISAVRLSIHSGGFVFRSQFRFPPPRVEVLETVWGDRGRGELPRFGSFGGSLRITALAPRLNAFKKPNSWRGSSPENTGVHTLGSTFRVDTPSRIIAIPLPF
ncbi:hypothetical protein BDFG_07926, partial [Blastomyces dermatitidis ATCC 26199]